MTPKTDIELSPLRLEDKTEWQRPELIDLGAADEVAGGPNSFADGFFASGLPS